MSTEKDDIRGEGNPKADQNYRKATRKFVEDGKVEKAAREAADMSEEEKKSAQAAEEEAKSRKKS